MPGRKSKAIALEAVAAIAQRILVIRDHKVMIDADLAALYDVPTKRLKFSSSTPYAFTEHGALMAASVFNTPRAVEVSLFVVRAFVQLRETLGAHKELAGRLDELGSRIERKFSSHDQAIARILNAIRELMAPTQPAKTRRIGLVQTD